MHSEATIYTFLYATGALVSGCAAVFAWLRRPAPGALWGALAMLAAAWWSVCEAMEASTTTMTGHLAWATLSYVGATSIGGFLLLFALEYTGHAHAVNKRTIGLLLLVPTVSTIIAATNAWHHLLWTAVQPAPEGTGTYIYVHGPLYWLVMALMYGLIISALGLLVSYVVGNRAVFRRQGLAILSAVLIPLVGLTVYNFAPGWMSGVDPAILLTLTGPLVIFAVFRYRLFDVLPASRELLLETMSDAILVINADEILIDLNPAARTLFGLGPADLVGRPIGEVLAAWPELARTLVGKLDSTSVMLERLPDGRSVGVRLTPLRDSSGLSGGRLAVLREVSAQVQVQHALEEANAALAERILEIERLHSELEDRAIRDPLTRLFNRHFLPETLQREFGRAQREGYPVSLVMIDVDHFKEVNDVFGHTVGDRVLSLLGELLANESRSGDFACRYGGDEFLIVMPNATAEDAAVRAETWRESVKRASAIWLGRGCKTTMSLGVASFPDHGTTPPEVVDAADRAVYVAKAAGRDQVMLAPAPQGSVFDSFVSS